MSDDLPQIPLSRLRELKHHAEAVAAAAQLGKFNGSDLWRVYVGLEVNAMMANHWYEKALALDVENSRLNQLVNKIQIAVNSFYLEKTMERIADYAEKIEAGEQAGNAWKDSGSRESG